MPRLSKPGLLQLLAVLGLLSSSVAALWWWSSRAAASDGAVLGHANVPAAVREAETAADALAPVNGALRRTTAVVPMPSTISEPSGDAVEVVEVAAETSSLHGQVLHTGGRPAPDAVVSLIETRAGAPVSSGHSLVLEVDWDGRFSTAVPAWAWNAEVVLAARKPGWRPFSALLRIDADAVLEAHSLELARGHRISGRVVRDAQPVVDAHVVFDIAYGVAGVYGAGSEGWWAEGRLEEKRGSVRTDAHGFFEIGGLSPKEYGITISEANRPAERLPWDDFQVQAPDDRIYDLTSARLGVAVQGQAGPIEGAQIRATVKGRSATVESGVDPVDLEVPPNVEVQVTVSHPTIATVERVVQAPPVGQWLPLVFQVHTVERPRLTVVVRGATAAGLSSLKLRFRERAAGTEVDVVAAATEVEDHFVVEAVPLDGGPYFVILEPSGKRAPGKLILPQVKALELPASGEAEVEFLLQMGARCDVAITCEVEDTWSVSYSLVGPSGYVWYQRHRSREVVEGNGIEEEMESEWGGMMSTDFEVEFHRSGRAPSQQDEERLVQAVLSRSRTLAGTFPAGVYELQVTSDGFEDVTQPVNLIAGETASVHVELNEKQGR